MMMKKKKCKNAKKIKIFGFEDVKKEKTRELVFGSKRGQLQAEVYLLVGQCNRVMFSLPVLEGSRVSRNSECANALSGKWDSTINKNNLMSIAFTCAISLKT